MPGSDRALQEQIDEVMRRKVIGTMVELQKIVAQEAWAMIVTDSRVVGLAHGSPVLTGRYRGSHTIAIGEADTSVAPAPAKHVPPDAGPEDAVVPAKARSYVARVLMALQPFQRVTIANALGYARPIEHGHSRKAPRGVYEVTAHALVTKITARMDHYIKQAQRAAGGDA